MKMATISSSCSQADARRMRAEKQSAQAIQADDDQRGPLKKPAPNVLNRDFAASAPNQKWVADIT
jgi:transposase InsO family protein